MINELGAVLVGLFTAAMFCWAFRAIAKVEEKKWREIENETDAMYDEHERDCPDCVKDGDGLCFYGRPDGTIRRW